MLCLLLYRFAFEKILFGLFFDLWRALMDLCFIKSCELMPKIIPIGSKIATYFCSWDTFVMFVAESVIKSKCILKIFCTRSIEIPSIAVVLRSKYRRFFSFYVKLACLFRRPRRSSSKMVVQPWLNSAVPYFMADSEGEESHSLF